MRQSKVRVWMERVVGGGEVDAGPAPHINQRKGATGSLTGTGPVAGGGLG